jgi:hypothetical protein
VAGTVKLEKLGVPGVFMVCNTFADDAKSAAADNGMPTIRRREISSAEFYKLRGEVETIRPLVEGIFDDFINALITPLTPEEANPAQDTRSGDDVPAKITIEAESYRVALEEFNQIYLDKRWGDGLPLIPPTPEAVQWMLSGTSRNPYEILGKVNPKLGIATIEKIAINAVMAGAKPQYLPVIISAMEALTDETFDNLHVLASAGSFNLLIVVSGPIAEEIGMESGIGFMGHGWRANNTIGRSIRLSTLNIGHTWPGINDMGLTGRISPHTFFTFCENTELSPWQPYHASRGFQSDDSCVTVGSVFGESQTQHFYGGMIMTWTAPGVLDRMVEDLIKTERRELLRWGTKGVGKYIGSGAGSRNHMIILFPELAAEYKKMGYDQKSLQDEIYERASIPYDELTPVERKSLKKAVELGVIPEERKSVFQAALNPGGKVPVIMSPENLHLFVAGGVPGCAFSFSYYRVAPYNWTALMTKRISGATLTKAGSLE